MQAQNAGNSTTSYSPNTGVPLTTTVVKTHTQYLHLGNTVQRADYPLSEYHCRMASSPGSFSKGSGFKLRPEMEYLNRSRLYFSSVPQDKRKYSKLN